MFLYWPFFGTASAAVWANSLYSAACICFFNSICASKAAFSASSCANSFWSVIDNGPFSASLYNSFNLSLVVFKLPSNSFNSLEVCLYVSTASLAACALRSSSLLNQLSQDTNATIPAINAVIAVNTAPIGFAAMALFKAIWAFVAVPVATAWAFFAATSAMAAPIAVPSNTEAVRLIAVYKNNTEVNVPIAADIFSIASASSSDQTSFKLLIELIVPDKDIK